MVDIVRAVSAAAAIETPAIVNFADTQHFAMRSATRFGVRDLFSRILRNLVSFFKRQGGEAAFTVYWGRLDC